MSGEVTLFDPDRHASIDAGPLTDEEAHAAADRLASALMRDADRWQRTAEPQELGLYDGAAGGLWLLSKPAIADAAAEIRRGLADALLASLEALGDRAPSPGSFLVGDVGVLFAAAELGAPDADGLLLDALLQHGARGPTEILFGPPGRALAAAARHAATGDVRFAHAWRSTMAGVLDGSVRIDEQHFVSDVGRYLGVAHGVAGVAAAVLRSGDLATDDERARVLDAAERALHTEALHRGDRVNWPPQPELAPLVQWCHGAPGMLLALGALPPGERPLLDESLVGAARLTADAGAVAKGAGLCHGTAGNALGLLAAARRQPPAVAALARSFELAARRMLAHALGQLADEQAIRGVDLGWALNLYEGPPGVLYGLRALLGEVPLTAPALSGAQPWA